jgi:hypothetical protein
MRTQFLVLALMVSMSAACESKKSSPASAPSASGSAATAMKAPLVALTAASTLAAVRVEFNAHKGEPRFLTLLSPT